MVLISFVHIRVSRLCDVTPVVQRRRAVMAILFLCGALVIKAAQSWAQ